MNGKFPGYDILVRHNRYNSCRPKLEFPLMASLRVNSQLFPSFLVLSIDSYNRSVDVQ